VSADVTDHLGKVFALCVLVYLAGDDGVSIAPAQSRDELSQAEPLKCDRLLHTAEQLIAASSDLLTTVRDRRKHVEEMRDALGPDVAEQSAAILLEQERQLELVLHEARAVQCPSASSSIPSEVR
jgi:hypothetical protein